MRRSFFYSGFVLIDLIVPIAVVAAVAGLTVVPTGAGIISSMPIEIRNLISVVGAGLVQALRLRLTNIRKNKKEAWLPGNFEQSLLAGATAFVVLALIHFQYGVKQTVESELAVGIVVGWIGAEAIMVLVDKYILKKINIDLRSANRDGDNTSSNKSNDQ